MVVHFLMTSRFAARLIVRLPPLRSTLRAGGVWLSSVSPFCPSPDNPRLLRGSGTPPHSIQARRSRRNGSHKVPAHSARSMESNIPEPFDLSGYTFPDTSPLRRLRRRLLAKFPEDVAYADERFQELMGGPIRGAWLTHFAESTASAMRKRNESVVTGHLSVIAKTLEGCGPYLRDLIDVNYMEDLFYKVDVRSSRWGWRRVPPSLRQLYIDFWGRIIPRYVARLQPPKSRPTHP